MKTRERDLLSEVGFKHLIMISSLVTIEQLDDQQTLCKDDMLVRINQLPERISHKSKLIISVTLIV